ncbi:hypothetical protein CEXT_40041 [Caerostris extrusa]|uniref:Uncharacterized protein n=1 Tax=Caerostris extrusa TaxID=172846 RepID=A0AAV4MRK9_CAEEX|nr:hypothetical protein CEXT_40041 [Caerostris extrusa]
MRIHRGRITILLRVQESKGRRANIPPPHPPPPPPNFLSYHPRSERRALRVVLIFAGHYLQSVSFINRNQFTLQGPYRYISDSKTKRSPPSHLNREIHLQRERERESKHIIFVNFIPEIVLSSQLKYLQPSQIQCIAFNQATKLISHKPPSFDRDCPAGRIRAAFNLPQTLRDIESPFSGGTIPGFV